MYFFERFLFSFLRRVLQDFKRDAAAGVTAALVLTPQPMVNAQPAGSPACHRLHAGGIPVVAGDVGNASRLMTTGPIAVSSIMSSTIVFSLPISSHEWFIAVMAFLMLLVGGLWLGMLQFGMDVNFLPLPVIAGFTNVIAVIVAASQFGKLFGASDKSGGNWGLQGNLSNCTQPRTAGELRKKEQGELHA